MIKKFFESEAKTISSASLILAFSYVVSALFGLIRERLLAGIFGAGNEIDIYYTAFTIPDFIALIFIFGAVASAVIPIFNSHLIRSKQSAFDYLSNFFNVFFGFLIGLSIVLMLLAPFIIDIIAPGFSAQKKELTVELMRIMFLSPIILGLSNVISGVLQVFHKFLITSLCPILYNIGIITGIIFFEPRFGLKGLAFGVVFGALLHLLIQIPILISSGFKYSFTFNAKDPGIIKTIHLMIPRSIGLGAGQLNIIAITAIASTLQSGSIAVFNFANNLASIFLNAVAVSISTAAFPSMSMAFLKEENESFLRKFSDITRQILFLTIPASFLIFILRAQIVRVILGVGRFSWIDTKLTTACLGILAFNLTAQALILFFSKSFYAAHNTKIPAIISVVTVGCNIILSLAFVGLIKASDAFSFFMQDIFRLNGLSNVAIAGIALAYTLVAIIESIALFYFFRKKFPILKLKEISDAFKNIMLASLAMTAASVLVRHFLGFVLDLNIFWAVLLQLILSAMVGILVYSYMAHIMKFSELKIIKEYFLKKFLVKHGK